MKRRETLGNSPSYIYLIQDGSGFTKVGHSPDPHEKVEELISKQGPENVLLVFKSLLPTMVWARAARSALYEKYQHKKVKSGWFNLSQDDVNEIMGYDLKMLASRQRSKKAQSPREKPQDRNHRWQNKNKRPKK